MNYFQQIKAFRMLQRTKQDLQSPAVALWYALMGVSNDLGQRDMFTAALSTLAGDSGLSISGVKRARNALTQKGYVKWRERPGRSSAEYSVIDLSIDFAAHIEPQSEPQAVPQSEPQAVPQSEPQAVPNHKHNKLKQTKKNTPLPPRGNPLDCVPPEIRNEFNGFVEFRKKADAPMTDRAVEIALATLERLAPGDFEQQRQIINQSIFRGWKGLFAIKDSCWTHAPGNSHQGNPDSPTDRVLQMIRQEEEKGHG